MSSVENKVLNGYLGLIESLTPTMRLYLIKYLKELVKLPQIDDSQLEEAFGSWLSEESVEEIINTIRESRSTNRKIEEF
jgi:hypothetical protein